MSSTTTMTAGRPLGTADLAGLLGCSVRTLRGYVRQGKVPRPVVLSRRRWFWDPRVVADFLRAGVPGGRGRG
jgi:hypothetical protein